LDSFEQAQSTGNKEEHRRLMTFAIVGGGATEIKLSATLAEMRKFVLSQNYPGLNINEKRIILLDGSSRLLSAFSEKSSKEVTDYLKKHDVEIKLNQRVMGYENYQLALNDGTASNTFVQEIIYGETLVSNTSLQNVSPLETIVFALGFGVGNLAIDFQLIVENFQFVIVQLNHRRIELVKRNRSFLVVRFLLLKILETSSTLLRHVLEHLRQ
jgi:hypothetical protein